MCGFIGGAINYLMVNYLAIIEGVGGRLFLFLGWGIGDFEGKSAEKEWNLCVFF